MGHFFLVRFKSYQKNVFEIYLRRPAQDVYQNESTFKIFVYPLHNLFTNFIWFKVVFFSQCGFLGFFLGSSSRTRLNEDRCVSFGSINHHIAPLYQRCFKIFIVMFMYHKHSVTVVWVSPWDPCVSVCWFDQLFDSIPFSFMYSQFAIKSVPPPPAIL